MKYTKSDVLYSVLAAGVRPWVGQHSGNGAEGPGPEARGLLRQADDEARRGDYDQAVRLLQKIIALKLSFPAGPTGFSDK